MSERERERERERVRIVEQATMTKSFLNDLKFFK